MEGLRALNKHYNPIVVFDNSSGDLRWLRHVILHSHVHFFGMRSYNKIVIVVAALILDVKYRRYAPQYAPDRAISMRFTFSRLHNAEVTFRIHDLTFDFLNSKILHFGKKLRRSIVTDSNY